MLPIWRQREIVGRVPKRDAAHVWNRFKGRIVNTIGWINPETRGMTATTGQTQDFVDLVLDRLQAQRNQYVARLTAALERGGDAKEIETQIDRINTINALLVRIVATMIPR